MKKIIITTAVLTFAAFLLCGCSLSEKKITVETRVYSGDMDGLEYGSWKKETHPVRQGQLILMNSSTPVTASIDSVGKNSIGVLFSDNVVYPDKGVSTNHYTLELNKTYVFVAGGGISGQEIKIRYN